MLIICAKYLNKAECWLFGHTCQAEMIEWMRIESHTTGCNLIMNYAMSDNPYEPPLMNLVWYCRQFKAKVNKDRYMGKVLCHANGYNPTIQDIIRLRTMGVKFKRDCRFAIAGAYSCHNYIHEKLDIKLPDQPKKVVMAAKYAPRQAATWPMYKLYYSALTGRFPVKNVTITEIVPDDHDKYRPISLLFELAAKNHLMKDHIKEVAYYLKRCGFTMRILRDLAKEFDIDLQCYDELEIYARSINYLFIQTGMTSLHYQN